MKVGNYNIDETGMMECLDCSFKTWGIRHRCWGPARSSAKYIEVVVPEFVITVSRMQREIWACAKRNIVVVKIDQT